MQGDVIGVGYRPRTGTIFFTRNGKKLDDVAHGLKTPNLFPAVGANGPCSVHVNFGQSGFVFIEANVKKWGLAPMTGSLAPPPPYGSEQGSILLETGRESAAAVQRQWDARHGRTRSGNFRGHGGGAHLTSPGPVRSPTDISLAHLVHVPSHDDAGEGASAGAGARTYAQAAGHAGPGLAIQVQDHTTLPPPEYSSPVGSRRGSGSTDGGEEARLLGGTAARTAGARARGQSPPIPSYSDAVAEGEGLRGAGPGPGPAAVEGERERSRSGTV